MDLQWLCRSRSNETSVHQVNRIRRYVNSLSCFLLCVLKFNWQMPTELPRWIPLLRYYQFTLVSLRAGGHWNWSLFGSFIIMRRQAKKKRKDKTDMHRWHITRHLWPAISYGTSKCGRSRDKYIPDGWWFCFDQAAYIYGIYIRHPGPWLLAGRNGKSVMDHSLAPFFFFFFLSISFSERYSFLFLIFGAIPLFPTFSTLIQPSDDKKDESESPAAAS